MISIPKLEDNEVIHTLLNKNLKIVQRPDFFNFSLDSLLVSEFLSLTRNTYNILDLGTGNGAIPLFLSQRTKAKITGIELQEISATLAKKNILLNGLEDRITIIKDDMKNWKNYFKSGEFDAIVTNPPFFKYNGTITQLNDLEQLTFARHEIMITLEEILKISSKLLKDKGYFSMVHRPDRLLEILDLMRKYKIMPKKIQFCHSKLNKQAKILLIEGVKNGNNHLTILPPLITHNSNGGYSDTVLELFNDI